MMTLDEIDTVIQQLAQATECARRAKRVQLELGFDPEVQLRQARTTALSAVRTIANHFPPEMKPAREPARV